VSFEMNQKAAATQALTERTYIKFAGRHPSRLAAA